MHGGSPGSPGGLQVSLRNSCLTEVEGKQIGRTYFYADLKAEQVWRKCKMIQSNAKHVYVWHGRIDSLKVVETCRRGVKLCFI